jgi:hypothetical protein
MTEFLKFILPLRYFGLAASAQPTLVLRGRSARKEVITEFTLLGSLDVQINKKGGCSGFWL